MELREFAERVLFGTSLAEKLGPPGVITDAHPGPSLAVPLLPGRPAWLQFKPPRSPARELPSLHRLEEEGERGRLLHFFANHELLAAELMALVLLRFPEAPPPFRQGVLQTLRDEQIHTRLYLHRMEQCGIHFGDLPVSGYFWRTVSTMSAPIDYVAGLSLTFEQANLDFCRHFARAFEQVGDPLTAQLLNRVYHDEIGHVAYGLKWFRRWKDPRATDWEAFCQQLRFPLSPRRAKGFAVNIEGRRAAGFDPAFIAELEVYSQSKGRTPTVLVFNPFSEGCLAQGKSFTPGQHQAQLARDLSHLPQFLGQADDVVLVPRRPPVPFLAHLKQAGFPLPEFVELTEGVLDSSSPLLGRKLGRLRPWAWGPDSLELLAPLFPNVAGEACSPARRFNAGVAELYSKGWSASLLRTLLSRWPGQAWLCGEEEVGIPVETMDAALQAITAIRRRGHHRVVVKEALGLAGSNAIRLFEPELLEHQRRWMNSKLSRGQQLVIEPWLERLADFSIQFEMGNRGLQFCGYTGLINDQRGQFQANWAEANYARRLPSRIAAYFKGQEAGKRFSHLLADLRAALETRLATAHYKGPAGVDAFVYRTALGECRLKPVVEINPRYTMGRLTLELMKRVFPGSHGLFRLVNRPMLQEAGVSDFSDYARRLRERFPLVLDGEPVARIREGALPLSDPESAMACLALFHVSGNLDQLLSPLRG